MNEEDIHEYPILVGHSDYGDPECCGIIMPSRNGEYVDLKRNPGTADIDLMCNECGPSSALFLSRKRKQRC